MEQINSEHIPYQDLSNLLEASYEEVIPDTLHILPTKIFNKYAICKHSSASVYASVLHLKHMSKSRHFYLVAKHQALENQLLSISAQLTSISQQNDKILSDMKIIQSDIKQIKSKDLRPNFRIDSSHFKGQAVPTEFPTDITLLNSSHNSQLTFGLYPSSDMLI